MNGTRGLATAALNEALTHLDLKPGLLDTGLSCHARQVTAARDATPTSDRYARGTCHMLDGDD